MPLDGTPFAETALPYIEYMASRLSMEVVLARSADPSGPFSGFALVDLTEEIEKAAEAYLEEVASILRGKGLSVTWRVLRGRPGTEVAHLAQELQQDLIVLATHGRRGVSRWVVGSVAEAVVRASGDPVLVIPPP